MSHQIYGLTLLAGAEIRYVGKATNPKRRLTDHLRDARDGLHTHKAAWIRANYELIELLVLETVPDDVDWQDREKHWIKKLREEGHRLTNGTDGGDGGYTHDVWKYNVGAKRTGATKLKMSLAQKGKPKTEAHIQAVSEALKGNKACGKPGITNNAARLTEREVVEIRRLSADGVPGTRLAEQFHVTRTNISFIVRRKTWTHL